jgi:hypothetical protein
MARFWLPSTLLTLTAGLALSVALGGAVIAQASDGSTPAPQVIVHVGPALAAKAPKLGQSDVSDMATELANTVRDALKGRQRANAPVSADLILEDATPNRPTIQQLSDNPGLSERSIALGGAAVRGVVTFTDGRTEALSYSFHQNTLGDDIGVGQWTDAERTFEMLADSLAHGRIPHDHLDIRTTDRSFDQWPH